MTLHYKLTVYIKYGNCFISKPNKNVLLQNVSHSLLQNATVLLQYVLTVIAKWLRTISLNENPGGKDHEMN